MMDLRKMNNGPTKGKPPVVWVEGLLDYFNAPFPHGPEDPRRIGFSVGRQIIGLYLIEMLLQYALDELEQPYDFDHNLHALFINLPPSLREAAENRHARILADRVEEAWDFQRSADAFLEYLGDDPMTDTRYFWERQHLADRSVMLLTDDLRHLIDALIIELHGYPEGPPLEKRYKTNFQSFEESWERSISSPTNEGPTRPNKRIGAHISWLEGVLTYFHARVPYSRHEHRRLGSEVGKRIVGLYLTEMILKYAVDDLDRDFGRNHNLLSLFKKLPRPRQRATEKKYKKLLRNSLETTWDHAETVKAHLEYLGEDPLTDTRYFWLSPNQHDVPLSAWPIMPLASALFIELHNYPEGGRLVNRYDTKFLPFEAVKDEGEPVEFPSRFQRE